MMNKKYFDSSFKKIVKLASILNIIDISTFVHIRVTKTGKYFILCNNAELVKYFNKEDDIGDYFVGLVESVVYGKISVNLWPISSCDNFFDNLIRLNIQHGISVSYCLSNYVDIFSFATDQSNEKINNFYLNNLHLLKRFIIYFRIKAKRLIEEQSEIAMHHLRREIQFNECISNDKIKRLKKFREEIFARIFPASLTKKKEPILTEKESEYLFRLLEGKSTRKIAEELGISQRTIEACLENIKLKTGYYTKAQLLSAFLEDQTFQLRIFYD